jgi:succinyl-CoA synthetase alpha subunit
MQAIRRPISAGLQQAIRSRGYASAASPYASTNGNLRIDSNTKVIFQGFTGKQGSYVVAAAI